MTDRMTSRVAWIAFWFITGLFGVGLAISVLNLGVNVPQGYGPSNTVAADLLYLVMFSFAVVGVLIASRQPENGIGWIFLATGLSWGLDSSLLNYSVYGLLTHPSSVPGPGVALALESWLWLPSFGLLGIFTLLLFPNGKLLSRGWRPLASFSVIVLGITSLATLLSPGRQTHIWSSSSGIPVVNPLGITALGSVLRPLQLTMVFIPLCIAGAALSLARRFRRSQGVERLQLKWITAAAATVAALYLVLSVLLLFHFSSATQPLWMKLFADLVLFSLALIPIAAGIAILKYRLYDIDLVINKTVVFGALAAFITLVYVAIVVGIGHLIGSGDKPNLALSILATAVVAVAFQPVRERVQHVANRLVYGNRATPYEILSQFSDKVAETYATEDVLPKMARTVAEGTGAAHAEVWLRAHDQLRSAAVWPEDQTRAGAPRVVADGRLPHFDGIDKAIPVRHQGELLGALTVTKPPGEPLTPGEEGLLTDLASQAGLVLRNVGLTAQLLARLDELKASRQRLVAAQDQERRRLERDLHDGAQQHLVALKTRLALAERLTERDPGKAEQLIATLEQDAGEALETLRDLARGIYPPLLADQGLVAALDAQARKAPVAVEVHGENIARYPQEIEAAVYFCCLEALQNVAKYASATTATIELSADEATLEFVVRDDGAGFDAGTIVYGSGLRNMSDRVEALDGSLSVTSHPLSGTAVSGRVPIRTLELVP